MIVDMMHLTTEVPLKMKTSVTCECKGQRLEGVYISFQITSIDRHLLLGRKVMTYLDSISKSRDITWSTKVHLVKAMVFQRSCMDVRVGL